MEGENRRTFLFFLWKEKGTLFLTVADLMPLGTRGRIQLPQEEKEIQRWECWACVSLPPWLQIQVGLAARGGVGAGLSVMAPVFHSYQTFPLLPAQRDRSPTSLASPRCLPRSCTHPSRTC